MSLRYEFQTLRFAGKKMQGRFFAELSSAVRYSDMFTLSSHIEDTSTTFSFGYTF
jgi:hypothetical protein